MKKIGLIGLILAFSLIAPSVSFAQSSPEAAVPLDGDPEGSRGVEFPTDGGTSGTIGENTGTSGTIGENTGTSGTIGENVPKSKGKSSLTNPLKSKTLTGFLQSILDVILIFAVPIIVLFIIYGGFQLVTARGNQTKLQSARATLTWAIVGGVIVLAANLILDVITSTVNAI